MDYILQAFTKGLNATSIAILIFAISVFIFGLLNSKTPKGRKVNDTLEAVKSISQAAFTEASQQTGLTGKERKNFAVDFVQEQLNKLGFKNVSVKLIAPFIEDAYANGIKIYEKAYNWGLSTNTDGSEKLADVNLNGIPDSQETTTTTSTSTTVKPTITTTLPPQPQQVSTDSSVVITQATQEPQQLK